MAAGQDDAADRIIVVSSPEPMSENQANCNGLSFKRKSIAKKESFPHLLNVVLVMWCVIAILLDPLFCYILVVDQQNNCIVIDKKLRHTVVVLRSLIDFGYLLLVVCQFRIRDTASPDRINGGFCSIARKFPLSFFIADILAALPFPQVMVSSVFRAIKAPHFTIAIKTFESVLVFQLFPRVIRVYSFLKKVIWSSCTFSRFDESKAIFSLFLYMLASHVLGAFWYLLSIERKATCLQVRCHSHPYCPQNYNNSSIERLCMDGCSGKASSGDIAAFDFGIFGDAFNSGIAYSTNFIWKFSYCSWWGLQNLSSLGQGLKTSGDIWEIYFAVSLTVSGLVLIALLIGNLQTILQAKASRQQKSRIVSEEIIEWMIDQKLPPGLKKRIKQYEKNKWQKSRDVDIVEIFHNLPRDLRVQTTRHLCYDAIKRVQMFQCAGDKFWDAICVCLKPILHTAHISIISKGDPLEEVIFITKGKLWMYSNSNSDWDCEELKEGDYFGEDLIKQAIKHPHLSTVPISTKTLYTRTEVEAFVLSAKDLNIVINKYWWHFSQELRKNPSYNERRKNPNYKEPWAPRAALLMQRRWRRNIINESGNSQPPAAKNIRVFGFTIERLKKALVEEQINKESKRCKDMPGPSNYNV